MPTQNETSTADRIREEAHNPFNLDNYNNQKERASLTSMRKPTGGKRRGCCSDLSLFFQLYTEQFNATMLLLPALFYTIGFFSATLQLLLFSIVAAFSAKLMVESSRLQVGNYHMHNKEDFESLVCSNRYILSSVVSATQNAYPMLLIIGTAISITLVSALADEIINMTVESEEGITNNGQYFVNLLKAQDSHMKPIPDSELIQISRGYVFVLVLGLLYSATIGPRQLYCGLFFKVIAILGLFVGACFEMPQTFWESLL